MMRRRRRADRELGFTIVELLVTITIMGLIVTPLSMAAIQALNLVPDSGSRTQVATDSQLLTTIFSSDIAQMQQFSEQIPWGNTLSLPSPAYNTTGWTMTPGLDIFSATAVGTTDLFAVAWRDLGAPASSLRTFQYRANVTAVGTNTSRVEISRTEVGTTTSQMLLRVFCPATAWCVLLNAVQTSSEGFRVDVSFNQVDRGGRALSQIALSATVRAQQS
jgi:Tfp pilus assembly protein PilV